METKELARPVKGVSTVDIIKGIEKEGIENYVPFPIERAGYLRSKCSDLRYVLPKRRYTVNEHSEIGEARVWWKSVENLEDK